MQKFKFKKALRVVPRIIASLFLKYYRNLSRTISQRSDISENLKTGQQFLGFGVPVEDYV
jgi:hypothetical protein